MKMMMNSVHDMQYVMKISGGKTDDNSVGRLYIYEDVAPDGFDIWSGERIVSETSEGFIRNRLAELDGVERLEVHISSRGGDVMTGFNLYSQIKAFDCPEKVAFIDGVAASVATVIAMACEKVIISDVGMMIIHNAWSCVKGNAEDMRRAADELDKISGLARDAYIGHAGGKLSEDICKKMMDEETALSPVECLTYGLADEIGGENADVQSTAKVQQSAVIRPQQAAECTCERERNEKTENKNNCTKKAALVWLSSLCGWNPQPGR